MTAMYVDAHHHLWEDPDRVPWLSDPGHDVLRRPFVTPDLTPILEGAGITGTVLVEAGTGRHEELSTLLATGDECRQVLGVVGWLDARTDARDVAAQAERAFAHPLAGRWLKGLRIQAQSESADHLTTEAAHRAAVELAARQRVLEVVLRPEHLPGAAALARRVPEAVFVIDHAGKPHIANHSTASFGAWRHGMADLATCASVYVKVSGLVTEANWLTWTWQDLEPYVATLVELFGPERLMLGSDWPVCLLAAEHSEVFDAAEKCLAGLSPEDFNRVAGGTATYVYQLEDPNG